MRIAFYGSSLLSSYWNGAATYYRGLLSALADRGHSITFYEPDAYDRQSHRDIEPPDWAKVVVYPATEAAVRQVVTEARDADVVVKASGVGVFDDALLAGVIKAATPSAVTVFWDVDAPATLAEISIDADHPIRRALPRLDAVLTYGGGRPVIDAYEGLGARVCVPIYNGLDPVTHHPVPADPSLSTDLLFLGNRLPDRETRVEQFFLSPARALPDRSFLLAGSGWAESQVSSNVRLLGHAGTARHNALNASALAVLNIARDSMASVGFSPATRVFEAAGAGACLVTDYWEGIELFLRPDEEILVARDGNDVIRHMAELSPARAREIGQRALARVLADHTYARRAALVEAFLADVLARRRATVVV
jgi:spore maturation protein CgeB